MTLDLEAYMSSVSIHLICHDEAGLSPTVFQIEDPSLVEVVVRSVLSVLEYGKLEIGTEERSQFQALLERLLAQDDVKG
jgi:hypothetical protein